LECPFNPLSLNGHFSDGPFKLENARWSL
jgi:hypothetical protein